MNGFQATGIPDAPDDGSQYGRNSRKWNNVPLGFISSNGSGITIPASIWTTITGWTTSYDSTNSHFDGVNGIFTCPVSGIWEINSSINIESKVYSNYSEMYLRIIKNSIATSSSFIIQQFPDASPHGMGGIFCANIYLELNDTLSLQIYLSAGGNLRTDDTSYEKLSIFKLGPSGGTNPVIVTQSIIASEKTLSQDSIQTSSPSIMSKLKSLVGLK